MTLQKTFENNFTTQIRYQGIHYFLVIPHPRFMLQSENISWEAKGYLSYLTFIEGDLGIPEHIINELIERRYFREIRDLAGGVKDE